MTALKKPRPPKRVKKPKSTAPTDGMGYPNQLVSMHDGGDKYPLMKIVSRTDKGFAGLFVDEIHGEDHWIAWESHPPSWMDPELFVKMAADSTAVVEVIHRICDNGSSDNTALIAQLEAVFTEIYLDFVFRKFEKAAPFMAEWLVADEIRKRNNYKWQEECDKQDKLIREQRKKQNVS